MRHANIKGDAGLWNLITSPELRNLGLMAALPKLLGSSDIQTAKRGWKQGGTSKSPWQRTRSQFPGTWCCVKESKLNAIIKQNWGKWSFKWYKSLSQAWKTSSVLWSWMGRVLHAERKHQRRKTAQHFCTSGIWDGLMLLVQLQCLAFPSHRSADPQAAVSTNSEQPGLHFAPHQRKCRACSVIHLSDPVHKKHCSYWQDLAWQKACQQELLLSFTPLATTEVHTKAIVLETAVLAVMLNACF